MINFDGSSFNFAALKMPRLKLTFPNQLTVAVSLVLASALTPSRASSDTFARVFPIGGQAMITIYRARNGGSDADAKALYEAMNLPPQDSMLGPGKGFKDVDQILSWVCADRGQAGFHCSISIRKDAKTIVSENPVTARYEATGDEAKALLEVFTPNGPDGSFKFVNQESTFSVEADQARFVILFRE